MGYKNYQETKQTWIYNLTIQTLCILLKQWNPSIQAGSCQQKKNKIIFNEPNETQINEKSDKIIFRILNAIARTVKHGVKLTHDVPLCHESST